MKPRSSERSTSAFTCSDSINSINWFCVKEKRQSFRHHIDGKLQTF
jgi:hypothetical protein